MSSAASRAHYTQAGFNVSVNGMGLSTPCGIMCPRRRRQLSVPEGIFGMCWGGVDGLSEICGCDIGARKADLTWRISAQGACFNKHCAHQGFA